MPIEAVKIPQNVYVEDRIIGPITMKQLLITGIGAGISYGLYATATKAGYVGIATVVITWTPAVIAAAFAFLKINDLSLFNIILLMIEGMNKPNTRYWSPSPGLSINVITRYAATELVDNNKKVAANAEKLAEITKQLEKRQKELSDLSATSNPDVATRIDAATQSSVETKEEVVATEGAQTPRTYPVRADKVKVQGQPSRSIDGIAQSLNVFDQFLKSQ
jgi:hypothetical protein